MHDDAVIVALVASDGVVVVVCQLLRAEKKSRKSDTSGRPYRRSSAIDHCPIEAKIGANGINNRESQKACCVMTAD